MTEMGQHRLSNKIAMIGVLVFGLFLWAATDKHQTTPKKPVVLAYNPDEISMNVSQFELREAHRQKEQLKSSYQIPRFLATARITFQPLDRTADAGYVVLELPMAKFDGNNQIFGLLSQWKISPQEKAEDDPFLVLEKHSFGDYRAPEGSGKAVIYKIFVGRHLSKICALAVCCAEGKTKQLFSIQRDRLIPVSD